MVSELFYSWSFLRKCYLFSPLIDIVHFNTKILFQVADTGFDHNMIFGYFEGSS